MHSLGICKVGGYSHDCLSPVITVMYVNALEWDERAEREWERRRSGNRSVWDLKCAGKEKLQIKFLQQFHLIASTTALIPIHRTLLGFTQSLECNQNQ